MEDKIISFHFKDGSILGRFVRLENVLQEIFQRKEYPYPVKGALSEACALSGVLANSLKYEGAFKLQIQGDGQIPMLVVDISSNGKIRATCKFNAESIKKAQIIRKTEGMLESAPYFLGSGHMGFTVDQGENMEKYQGIVKLDGVTLGECANKYFEQSEQIETDIKIFVGGDNNNIKAAAFMIQKMPNKSSKDDGDNLWQEAKILLQTLSEQEALDYTITGEKIIHRLYHEHLPVISGTKILSFGCSCSKERVADMLKSFSYQDIENMKTEGKISVICDFCGEKYIFDEKDIQNIRNA